MSLKGWLFGDFIENIYLDSKELFQEFDLNDKEILYGAKITIQKGQMVAIKVDKVIDILTEGSYTLDSNTLPNIASYLKWDEEYDDPFTAKIYFLNRANFTFKWETLEPILLRDRDDTIAKIDITGYIEVHISDVSKFVSYVLKKKNNDLVVDILYDNLVDAINQRSSSIYSLAQDAENFSFFLKSRLVSKFTEQGLILNSLNIEYLDVEQILENEKIIHKSIDRSRYFIIKESKPNGPYSKKEIEEMIEKTELIPASYIWKEGLKDWVKVKDIFNVE